MQYHGGKATIAKDISQILNDEIKNTNATHYLEPFIGGGNVAPLITNEVKRIISDVDEDIIILWKAMLNGWVPPEIITEEEYKRLKSLTGKTPLKSFAAYGCSFMGKKWGGYARNKKQHNYAKAAKNGLLKKVKGLHGVTVNNLSYDSYTPGVGWVVYCDPPYENTTGYKGTAKFNHELFWKTVQQWADNGAIVYVSEYTAPKNILEVWSKEKQASASLKDKTGKVTEKLFKLESE